MDLEGTGLGIQPDKPRRRRLFVAVAWAACFFAVGILCVAFVNKAVIWSSSDSFCGQFCHSMNWASAAYKRGPHYQNASGVSASCGECHIPYDSHPGPVSHFIYLLGFKANRGAKDFYNEAVRTINTKEEWEKRRPGLALEFEGFIKKHNYITCRGCHHLNSFGGSHSVMKQMIHSKMLSANDYDCLHCHSNIGHVYEDATPAVTPATSNGATPAAEDLPANWYSSNQAESGSKLYAQSCSSCHGAKLEGGGGPSLVGSAWKQLYAGKKLLTLFGEIHGPMAQYAGTTFSEQQSLDLVAFLLQQNGYPAGSKPLTDPGSLNRQVPKT